MPPDRFDSGASNPVSATITPSANQNAPMRRLERLRGIRTERLSGDLSCFIRTVCDPALKGGEQSKTVSDETLPPWFFNTKGGFILVK